MRISQRGIIHLPVLVFLALIGLAIFLVVSSTAPFKDNLLNAIFPKPESLAADVSLEAESATITGPITAGNDSQASGGQYIQFNDSSPIGQNPLPADLDGNGRVDIFDYNLIVRDFGKSGSNIQGDVDKNGFVNIFDYNSIVRDFGTVGVSPGAPAITRNVSCINGPVSGGQELMIGWTNTNISYVDISDSASFGTWYHKAVSNTNSIAAPIGFTHQTDPNQQLSIQPNVPYYVRLWNGTQHSPVSSFVLPHCNGSSPMPTATNSCPAAPTNTGYATLTIQIPTAGTYAIWSRITTAGDTANSYSLQIDSACPIVVGDKPRSDTDPLGWVWVDFQQGNAANKIHLNLSAGTHTLKLIGREANLKLDKLVLTNNLSCLPTGLGTNCSGATPTPTSTPVVSQGTPTLIDTYRINGNQIRQEDGGSKLMIYRPRQFQNNLVIQDATHGNQTVSNAGSYAGWDVLNTPNIGIFRITDIDNWVSLKLNRSATVAIIWFGGSSIPNWLNGNGWNRGTDVTINGSAKSTYRKTVGAGDLNLGSVYSPGTVPCPNCTRDAYWILFSEQSGQPSTAPSVPTGMETPQPNQTCPAWVHDQYMTQGADGKMYRAWHPQIDPVYWCYFRHEHGTSPAVTGVQNWKGFPFHYEVDRVSGMSEFHEGFKGWSLSVEHPENPQPGDTIVYGVFHFGTDRPHKVACVRFHSYYFAVARNGQLLARLQFLGDTGAAVNMEHLDHLEPIRPSACPNQFEQSVNDSTGNRRLSVGPPDGTAVRYQPYRVGTNYATLFKFATSWTMNTPNRVAFCDGNTCDRAIIACDIATNPLDCTKGDQRFMMLGPQAQAGFGIEVPSNGPTTGTFYTDPYGRSVRLATDSDAIQQFLAPGLNIHINGVPGDTHTCVTYDSFGRTPHRCDRNLPQGGFTQLEGSLQSAN